MKANHRSVYDRLTNKIQKLELRFDNMWNRKKFYPQCKSCRITNVEANIRGEHYSGCTFKGLDKEIIYYKKLRDESR